MQQLAMIQLLLLALCSFSSAFKECPYLGPDFSIPTKLSSSTTFQKGLFSLKSKIEDGISTGLLTPNTTSFSVEIFSTKESSSLFEYHHTAPNLLSPNGTKLVDGNSIYRIASISKLFTVYAFLIEKGDVYFNDPITKYVPELSAASRLYSGDVAADFVDWRSVTIGQLASQISGIGRDYSADLVLAPLPLTGLGFPPLNAVDFQPCLLPGDCTREQFFKAFIPQHPIFPTSTTPTYSNVAFQILGYALENITKKPFGSIVQRSLIDKLHLNGTSSSPPKDPSHMVIPSDAAISGWDLDFKDFTPAGGIFSTSHDLTIIGRSILTSSLLSPPLTRRWLKPVTHTASPYFSIGAPWEIWRYQLPSPSPPKIVDIYTKEGDYAAYHSNIALIPDWGIGFVVLHADAGIPTADFSIITNFTLETVLPSVEAASREEAASNFAGTYKSKDGTLNSSITISTSPSHLGLGIDSFISNNTDMFVIAASLVGALLPADVSIRLYPTGLMNKVRHGKGGEVSWRAVFENKLAPDSSNPFFECATWAGAGNIRYGGVAVDDFTFVVSEDGKAASVEARALRLVLERT